MNNACPNCGAVYAVAEKDIGRKIKCKKCSTGLRVNDSGLVVDVPSASPPPPPPPAAAVAAAVVDDDYEDDEPAPKKIKKPGRAYAGGPGLLTQVGGIPTILFAVGLFMSVWFTFQQGPIAEAAVARAGMSVYRIKLDQVGELKNAKGDAEKVGKIMENYAKKEAEAGKEAAETTIDVIRGVKWDRYGQLLGFVILAFGCIGYLRTEQMPVMHYVAGVILAGMMLAMFSQASGCSGGRNELMNADKYINKGGKGGGFDFP